MNSVNPILGQEAASLVNMHQKFLRNTGLDNFVTTAAAKEAFDDEYFNYREFYDLLKEQNAQKQERVRIRENRRLLL